MDQWWALVNIAMNLGSVKCEGFLDYLSDYHYLMKGSAPCK
jgi:hypothetical protein